MNEMSAGHFVEQKLCNHVMTYHRSEAFGYLMVRWSVDGCLCQGMYRKERGLKISGGRQMCVVDVDLAYS